MPSGSTSERRRIPESKLYEVLSFGTFAFSSLPAFGTPFQLVMIAQSLSEMDLEVGERMNLFGMGRISVVEEQVVAGRRGVLIRFEVGDASDRRLSAEWVIDTRLPLPLAVREYDDEGRMTLQSVLTRYEGN